MIFVIDSDEVMAGCLVRILKKEGKDTAVFSNGIEAMDGISEKGVPEMIFLDVMLTGPDGFTFLNEMASYADTMKVPIVIVSEKDFSEIDLKAYSVVGFLNKNTMKPEDVSCYVREHA